MGIINAANDVKAIFFQNWITKYVPAIISYGIFLLHLIISKNVLIACKKYK